MCAASLSVVASPFDFAHLHRAWLNCRRGKGNSRSRWAFELGLERHLLDLSEELQSRRYQPCPSVCFVCDQPKRREIFAAAFRDRVVHHLLVGQLEPWWERHFIFDSYACRLGKGTLAAVLRSQQFIRQVSANGSTHAWALHLDIRSFFVRINKQILLAQLEQGLRSEGKPWAEDLIWLTRVIVQRDPTLDAQRIGDGFASVPYHKSLYSTHNLTGLPIGNYSSQFFANVYLNALDQFVKHRLKARYYLRYVDDLLLFERDLQLLVAYEKSIEIFLREELQLELNPAARRLSPVSNGVDALGYTVWAHHKRLRRRTVQRFEDQLRQARARIVGENAARQRLQLRPGAAEHLMAQCMSYRGLLRHANTRAYLRALEQRHGWVGRIWRLDRRDHVVRRYCPKATPRTLAQQWHTFKQLWPGAVVLMQIGSYWEAFKSDADWLREVLGMTGGRMRVRLGVGAGFPLRQRKLLKLLLAQCDRDIVVVRETGRQSGAVRERAVALVLEQGRRQTPRWLRPPKH